jgi:GNAT superfamily N-acetyltransferase
MMDNVTVHSGDYTKENLRQIAELIYLTDPYIYEDLLFSVENAVKMLPLAIMQTNTIFSHENVVSLKYDGEVIAIAYYIDSGSVPENTSLLPFFRECNIIPAPTHAYAHTNYIQQVILESQALEGIHLICFCVNPAFRNRKLGSLLMQEFIGRFGGRKIYLEVLADNLSAVGLYQKFGFNIIGRYMGYPDYKQLECLKMCRCP